MNTRQAVQTTIIFCLENLAENKGYNFSREQMEEAAFKMHDDDNFLEDLLEFMDEHIECMGENYGL